jgi:hypothetical protein
MRKSQFIYLPGIFLLLLSCVRDNFDFDRFSDRISYRPSIVIPLVHGSMTLSNFLERDDSIVQFDSNDMVRLVIREESPFFLPAGEILKVPLPDSSARQFPGRPVEVDPFFTGAVIGGLAEQGRLRDHVPGTFPVRALENIDFVLLTGGTITMRVTNNLPVKSGMDILLFNDLERERVGLFHFEDIAPGETASQTASLSGIMVRKHMSLEIIRFSSPGSGGEVVLTGPDDDLVIEILSEKLLAQKGRARVAPVIISEGSDMLAMDFLPDQRIDELNIRKGKIHYSMVNGGRGLVMNVEIVNMTRKGIPWNFNIAVGGDNTGERVFSDVDIDLPSFGNHLLVNYTMSTGSVRGMTDFDIPAGMVGLNMHFSGLSTGYASGYFGKDGVSVNDQKIKFNFDILEKISGDFRFTNPSLRLFYENELGVPIHFKFDLEAECAGSERKTSLFDQDHQGFDIEYPVAPFSTIAGEIAIDRNSSEMVDFISLPPSSAIFTGRATKNQAGDTGISNFITSGSKLQIGMELELPLDMTLTRLGLTDTIEFEFNPADIDMIETFTLTLEVTNSFPLGISLDLRLYDALQGKVLYTFDDIVLMKAANVNEKGFVEAGAAAVSLTSLDISHGTVNLLRQATHVIITGLMDTGKHGLQQVPVKLLTTSSLDFRIRVRADLNITR